MDIDHRQGAKWLTHSTNTIGARRIALYGCILGVSLLSYLVFRVAVRGARWLNPIAMKLATRLMGLMLAAVAFQFMVNALRDLGVIPPP